MLKKWRKSGLSWLWLSVVVIALDHYSKLWAVDHLHFFEPYKVLPIFNFTLAYNTGAAFSFLHAMSGWQNIFLGSLALFISAMVIYWLSQLSGKLRWMCIALNLILAGALGNAWDRIRYGYVVDFLDFHWDKWHFAIFNVADSAICVGAFMLLWTWFRQAEIK